MLPSRHCRRQRILTCWRQVRQDGVAHGRSRLSRRNRVPRRVVNRRFRGGCAGFGGPVMADWNGNCESNQVFASQPCEVAKSPPLRGGFNRQPPKPDGIARCLSPKIPCESRCLDGERPLGVGLQFEAKCHSPLRRSGDFQQFAVTVSVASSEYAANRHREFSICGVPLQQNRFPFPRNQPRCPRRSSTPKNSVGSRWA